jgi:hypothetical protein
LAKNTERYHRYFRVLVFSYTEVVHGKEWIMRFLPKGDPRLYLGPDVWRVMYRGYYIPEAQTGDYAMLRAAEVVKAAGLSRMSARAQP